METRGIVPCLQDRSSTLYPVDTPPLHWSLSTILVLTPTTLDGVVKEHAKILLIIIRLVYLYSHVCNLRQGTDAWKINYSFISPWNRTTLGTITFIITYFGTTPIVR
jgi:hypothetical protein